MDAIERGIGKMKETGSSMKDKVLGDDIHLLHHYSGNDSPHYQVPPSSASSLRSASEGKESQDRKGKERQDRKGKERQDRKEKESQDRKGPIREQLFNMKKKLVINQIDVKRKVDLNAVGRREGDEIVLKEKEDEKEEEKEIQVRLRESEEREKVLEKRIDELEHELREVRGMKRSAVIKKDRCYSGAESDPLAGDSRSTLGQGNNTRRSCGENEVNTDPSQRGSGENEVNTNPIRRPSGDNLLKPYRRGSSDGKVSPLEGKGNNNNGDGDRRGSNSPSQGGAGSRDRSQDRGDGRGLETGDRGHQGNRGQQSKATSSGGRSPMDGRSPARGRSPQNQKKDAANRKESTGGELMFGR